MRMTLLVQPTRLQQLEMKTLCKKNVTLKKQHQVTRTATTLLEYFVKSEHRFLEWRSPQGHFTHYQALLGGQEILQKLHRLLLTYQDICDTIDNMSALQKKIEEDDAHSDFNETLQRLLMVIGDFALHLEHCGKNTQFNDAEWLSLTSKLNKKASPSRNEYGWLRYIPRVNDLIPVRLLGAGGFGSVYKTKWKPGNLECTLKLVSMQRFHNPKQACADKVAASMVQAAPFVIKYYCCFSCKGIYVTMMEYVRGMDIMRVLESCIVIDETQTKCIAAQLVLAIEYLHIRGILHRDLKVSNILLSPSGQIRVIDFDTCKICLGHYTKRVLKGYFRRTSCEFRDLEATGTLPYIAPEVLLRHPYGRAIDWWSVGCTIFKMVVGRLPFRGSNKMQLINIIIKGSFNWRNALKPDMFSGPSEKTRAVIGALLRRNAVERLGSKHYEDIQNHCYFEDVDFFKLANFKHIMEFPFVNQLMQHKLFSPTEEGDISTSALRATPQATKNVEKKKNLIKISDMRECDKFQQKPLYTFVSDRFKQLIDTITSGELPEDAARDVFLQSVYSANSFNFNAETTDSSAVCSNTQETENSSQYWNILIYRDKAFGLYYRSFGIEYTSVIAEDGSTYLHVTKIRPKTAASRSWLLQHDIITCIQGKRITSADNFSDLGKTFSNHDRIILQVLIHNPFRIMATHGNITDLIRKSETAECAIKLTGGNTILNFCKSPFDSSGFVFETHKTWNPTTCSDYYVHIVVDVDESIEIIGKLIDKNAPIRLFLGDCISAINAISLQYSDHTKTVALLKNALKLVR